MLYHPDLKPDLACTADSVCRPRQISWIRTFRVCQPCLRNSSAINGLYSIGSTAPFAVIPGLIKQRDDILNLEPRWLASGRNSGEGGGQAIYRTSAWVCRGLAEKSGAPLGGPRATTQPQRRPH